MRITNIKSITFGEGLNLIKRKYRDQILDLIVDRYGPSILKVNLYYAATPHNNLLYELESMLDGFIEIEELLKKGDKLFNKKITYKL